MPFGIVDTLGAEQERGIAPDLPEFIQCRAAKTEIGEQLGRREAAIGAGNQILGVEFLNFFILRRGAERLAPTVAVIEMELEIGDVKGVGLK